MADETEKTAEAEEEKPARTWPAIVKLEHPIEFGKRSITELTFQRGTVAAAKGIKFSGEVGADQLVLIASRLCGEPPALIERLDVDDGGEVMEIAMDFYVRYLGAGKKR